MYNSFFWHLNTHPYLANSGIPLFSLNVVYQIMLLIPIIIIEAYIHRKILQISVIQSSLISVLTNLISTIVGGFFFICFGVFIAPFIVQGTTSSNFPFSSLTIIITLIPMFYFSVFLEVLIGQLMLKKVAGKQIKKTFFIANAFTYMMLEIMAITQLILLGVRAITW
jgi:hypothetical protein